MIRVVKNNFEKIDIFLNRIQNQLIYYSPDYLKFLGSILKKSKLFYLVSYDKMNSIRGILPLSFLETGGGKFVLNSLPFFGSHGGILVDPQNPNIKEIYQEFYKYIENKFINENLISFLIIDNPISTQNFEKHKFEHFRIEDSRISQIKYLPNIENINETEKNLFESFHVKTRNAIRKGLKLNPRFIENSDIKDINWIQKVHKNSIKKMGGKYKTLLELETLIEHFPPPFKSRVYFAVIGTQKIAGLIVLLYKDTVEYFTPVVIERFKNSQILSSLIFYSMKKLNIEGYKIWNWGGTWNSQEGVFRFKNRFGSRSINYKYFIYKNQDLIDGLNEIQLKKLNHYYLYNYNK